MLCGLVHDLKVRPLYSKLLVLQNCISCDIYDVRQIYYVLKKPDDNRPPIGERTTKALYAVLCSHLSTTTKKYLRLLYEIAKILLF